MSKSYCVRVHLEIGHEATLRNKKTPDGFTHDWEVFVRGVDGADIHCFVDKVVFHLHSTFSKPLRTFKEPPFVLKESGYAGFSLPIDVYFKTKDEPRKLTYYYDLTLPERGTSGNVVRHKADFPNPSEDFRRKLIRGGGVGIGFGNDVSDKTNNSHYDESKSIHSSKNKLNNNVEQPKKHKPKESVKPEEVKSNNAFAALFGTPIRKFSPNPKPSSKSESKSHEKTKDSSGKSSKHSPFKDKDKEKENTKRDKEVKEKKEKDGHREKEKKSKKSTPPPSLPKEVKKDELKKEVEREKIKNEKLEKKLKEKKNRSEDKERKREEKHREEKKDVKEKEVEKKVEAPPAPPPPIPVKEVKEIKHKEKPAEEKKVKHKKDKEKTSDHEKQKHKHKKKDKHKKEEEKKKEKVEIPKPSKPKSPPMPPPKESSPVPSRSQKGVNPLNMLFQELSDKDSYSDFSEDEKSDVPPLLDPLPPPPKIKEDRKSEKKEKKKAKEKEREGKKRKRKSKEKDKEEPGDKIIKMDFKEGRVESPMKVEEMDISSHSPSMSPSRSPSPDQPFSDAYVTQLKDLQHKIMTLQNNADLQKVVQVISETGQYEITQRTFDFDLCALDKTTVKRLQDMFIAAS